MGEPQGVNLLAMNDDGSCVTFAFSFIVVMTILFIDALFAFVALVFINFLLFLSFLFLCCYLVLCLRALLVMVMVNDASSIVGTSFCHSFVIGHAILYVLLLLTLLLPLLSICW